MPKTLLQACKISAINETVGRIRGRGALGGHTSCLALVALLPSQITGSAVLGQESGRLQ